MSSETINIGVVGASHLGLVSTAAFSEKDCHVCLYSDDVQAIQRLKNKDIYIEEPGLKALLLKQQQRIEYSDDSASLAGCDIIYLAEDVATNDNNEADTRRIEDLLQVVMDQANPDAVIVVLAQVKPGFTRSLQTKQCLYYQVETLVFGQALQRALYPERFIVGCKNKQTSLNPTFRALLERFNCPIYTMAYESAELSKIAINCYLVSSVMTSNMLAELSQAVGADWNDIVPTLRCDRRIGEYAYLNPGLGLSGGNLERDLASIISLSKRYSVNTNLVSTWLAQSNYYRQWVQRLLISGLLLEFENPRLAVLGLAYKPNTNSIKNSPAITLLNQLSGYRVKVHDPIVLHRSFATQCVSMNEAIADADIIIVMTPWDEYQVIDAGFLRAHSRASIVIDPYGLLKNQRDQFLERGYRYYSLGQALQNEVTDNVTTYA